MAPKLSLDHAGRALRGRSEVRHRIGAPPAHVNAARTQPPPSASLPRPRPSQRRAPIPWCPLALAGSFIANLGAQFVGHHLAEIQRQPRRVGGRGLLGHDALLGGDVLRLRRLAVARAGTGSAPAVPGERGAVRVIAWLGSIATERCRSCSSCAPGAGFRGRHVRADGVRCDFPRMERPALPLGFRVARVRVAGVGQRGARGVGYRRSRVRLARRCSSRKRSSALRWCSPGGAGCPIAP